MVFFDLGWTLEDETPAQEARALRTVEYAAGLGIRLTVGDLLEAQAEAGGRGAPSVFPAALAVLGLDEAHHRNLRRLFPWDPSLCRAYPDGLPALGALAPAFGLGVLANQSQPMAGRLASYGMDRFFSVTVCSCEAGLEKPDPAVFAWAEDRARALGDPGPHWMVGDRIDNDIVPARARGWGTVRVVRGDYRRQRARTPGERADFETPSLGEAAAYLLSRV